MRELTWALLPEAALFAAAAAHNRAGVSRFYFGCFQNATGSSSGPCKVPELRIELHGNFKACRRPRDRLERLNRTFFFDEKTLQN